MTRQEAARSRRHDRGGLIVLDPALVGAVLLALVAAALIVVPGQPPAPRTASPDCAEIVSTFP